MATLALKSSHNEQRAVIHFAGIGTYHIRPTVQIWPPLTILFLGRWRKCSVGRNSCQILKSNQSSQHRSLHRAFRSLLTDGTNVWINLDNTLKN